MKTKPPTQSPRLRQSWRALLKQKPLIDRHLGFLMTGGLLAIASVLAWSVAQQDIDLDLVGGQQDRPAKFVVDINTDRAAEFANLPGIGPITAAAIVDHRIAIGDFKTIDQILEVKGVGPKTLLRVRKFLRIASSADAAERD